MKILVLGLSRRKLKFHLFRGTADRPLRSGSLELLPTAEDRTGLVPCLEKLRGEPLSGLGGEPVDGVAVLIRYGGDRFRGPELAGPEVLARLESLAPQAPLHVPSAAALVRAAGEVFSPTPVVLVCETAFFAALPAREYSYALESGMMQALGLRRFGHHGLYHEAACRLAADQRRQAGAGSPGRFLSICLEPRPEVAAVLGHLPLMVTGGATPFEGLPGETSCGEIDPSLVIALAERLGWGPEQIDDTLTRRSGLLGLTGAPVRLDEVFFSGEPNLAHAAELLRYRMLQACGAGIAALGGLDAIVFSGRYAALGELLGPWLRERICAQHPSGAKILSLERLNHRLERIAADRAVAPILQAGAGRDSGRAA